MHRHWLLHGRLSPPSFRVALLERAALTRLVANGLAHKAVLVSAPAGYGKTALLSQWRAALQTHAIPTAWVALTPDDSDPAQVLTYLTMSVIAAGVAVGPLENLAEQWFADTPIPAAVASLVGYLAQETRPFVVFIDDVHNASRVAAEQVLEPLLQAGLPHLHLAVAGRTRPPLALAALRARGELLEFEAEALRFDDATLATLLPDLTAPQRSLLAARTEGWPVALQLARLWLTAKPDRVALIEGFSGRTAEVAEYLTEQVLADLPADISETLETTSALEALSAGLVEAVTGRTDAWAAVLAIPELAHLVVPLDESRVWYRLHPLLADYLRDRLRRRAPSLEARSQARASLWFECKSMPLEAVRHAAAGGDFARAASLIEQTGGWELVIFGGAGLMRALLAEIPTDRLVEFPRVEVFRALLDAKTGALGAARARFDEAAATVLKEGQLPAFSTPIGRDLRVVQHLLGRYQDYAIDPGALDELYAELDQVAATDGVARAALLNTACLLGLGLGEMQAAHEACARAVREMRGLGSLLGINYCTLHLGVASLHLGHRREAEAMFREAADLAEENFGADSALRALADVHLAVALVTRGDNEGTSALLERSLAQVEASDGWLDVYAEAYAAGIAAALSVSNLGRAEEYVRRALATAERRGLKRLEGVVRALQTRLYIRTGRLDEARARHAWRPGIWRTVPFEWRVHQAQGIAAAELELASGQPGAARSILADLSAAASAGNRVRDARQVAYLDAAARCAAGEREPAAEALVALLEPAVREDDTAFLVDSGPLVVPLLQYARQWTRDRLASSLARQTLGHALARLSAVGASPSASSGARLSERETEVLSELVQGSPNKVIARALQMTENTVKFHLKNVFHKLGVKHRTEAIRVAREQGLIR